MARGADPGCPIMRIYSMIKLILNFIGVLAATVLVSLAAAVPGSRVLGHADGLGDFGQSADC